VDGETAEVEVSRMVRDPSGQIKRRFGARVRQLRLAKGLSQEEFALRAGLDRSYIGGL